MANLNLSHLVFLFKLSQPFACSIITWFKVIQLQTRTAENTMILWCHLKVLSVSRTKWPCMESIQCVSQHAIIQDLYAQGNFTTTVFCVSVSHHRLETVWKSVYHWTSAIKLLEQATIYRAHTHILHLLPSHLSLSHTTVGKKNISPYFFRSLRAVNTQNKIKSNITLN